MQPEAAKHGETDRSPEHVWNTIVRVTNTIGTDEAKSVRILLYLALLRSGRITRRDRLKHGVKFLLRLAVPREKALPPAPKGLPLLAFLYDAPSAINPLLPVVQAVRERGGRLNILLAEDVNLGKTGLSGASESVRVTDLMSRTTTREWFGALTNARRHFSAVADEFGRYETRWGSTIENNRAWILSELALALVAKQGLVRLFETWEPSFIVTPSNLWPFHCAVFTEAKRLRIPSFVIQHGVTNHYWWPFVANKMLLWGRLFENELLQMGAPPGQLAVCGMPSTDHLFTRYQGVAKNPAKTASTYVILSDTHGRDLSPGVYPRFKALLKQVLAATPNIHWRVKLHPVEDDSFYEELLDGRFPNFSILPKSTTLEEAVTWADVACTLWSTSGLEAMVMRRPLVVFDVTPFIYKYAWWPKYGGGTYVPTPEAMLAFVKEASSDANFVAGLLTKQEQFLVQNFSNPGRAANAILDEIQDSLRSTTSGDQRGGLETAVFC